MKTFQTALLAALISTSSVVTAHAYTDEDSYVAVSNTAMSVTGDIQFDDFSITFENGKTLSFSGLVSDTFVVDGEEIPASVYQVSRPGDPVLENGNRLCGSGAVTYIANWDDGGRSLIAVFTGDEAPSSNEEMCASYTYEQ
ncbi:hypothetical protein [Mesorhizobium sp. YR577]|uniref:hypothetical protein n=1 Tax=Mesorhizobium sp. YR577 TaxID=1884373 RepID=UPI0008DFC513|nr:hypothetical protein [Mesorhizobium sp. YR577]SFT85669.1 hypothetical protein SAMN05518861_106185 [Mesorhizobium sp. YR577]